MSLRIVSAEERLKKANGKTTICLFGQSGVGKTTLLKSLPTETTLCLDLEAGMKSVQNWSGDSISIRRFEDAIDLTCLIGGPNPSAQNTEFFSQGHYDYLRQQHAELSAHLDTKQIIFVDSITDLTRQAMRWAQAQDEAWSEKTGKPDTRAAYGLLGRQVIGLLKHLQHAPGRTVIFVGILERVTDDMNRAVWQPQMDGGKIARELPGIVDQVMTLGLFSAETDTNGQLVWRHSPDKGGERRLVCHAGNPWGLPAKDRSGRLDLIEPGDLGALLQKINAPRVT